MSAGGGGGGWAKEGVGVVEVEGGGVVGVVGVGEGGVGVVRVGGGGVVGVVGVGEGGVGATLFTWTATTTSALDQWWWMGEGSLNDCRPVALPTE